MNREEYGKLDERKKDMLEELLDSKRKKDYKKLSQPERCIKKDILVEIENIAKVKETSWRQKSRCL